VLVYSTYPIPDREKTCGILVLPVDGAWILIPGTLLSILFVATGMFISYRNGLSSSRSRPILFMILATAFAMILGFMGLWAQAVFLFILTILTLSLTASTFFK
jgi:hypothetical protein